jgi:HEPN domain-containing protein
MAFRLMKASANEWMQFAEMDLQAARIMLDHENIASIAAFHCQQAVEKCLKALLEEKELDVPKTHDLEKLAARVEAGWGFLLRTSNCLC